jgi:type IV secretory pathway TraG/TraD family ATPase VirD4
MITPLQLPWYWQSIDAIQSAFGSTRSKYAATVGSILVFVLFVGFIYRFGRQLKHEYNADAVEDGVEESLDEKRVTEGDVDEELKGEIDGEIESGVDESVTDPPADEDAVR